MPVLSQKLKTELKILSAAVFVGVLFAITIAAYTYVYAARTQQNIANNVIRFHVLANSDSTIDQNLKDQVRLAILTEFEETLSTFPNIETTRTLLTENLPNMQALAEDIIAREGFTYPVSANISQVFFPTRTYGNMSFPPGEYEAVQLIIGEGRGSNWWCLMFPPLCYVDMTSTEQGREQLSNTITYEGFRLLMHQESGERNLEVRFRVVEFWQNRNQPSPPEIQIIVTEYEYEEYPA